MEMTKESLSHQDLLNLLFYNQDSGLFYWKESRKRVKCGDVAGGIKKNGYVYLMVNGRSYRAHRLAWFYIYGVFPVDQIDHINRNRQDNRIENLRLADSFVNARNKGVSKNNSSGFRGICWDSKNLKWKVKITVSGQDIAVGRFKEIQEAVLARKNAEIQFWS